MMKIMGVINGSLRTIWCLLLILVTSFNKFTESTPFHTAPLTLRHAQYAITRVVIDAGHGGHDAGCLGTKSKEKDVALSIALKLGKYIEDHFPDVKVIYTRKTDVFVELHQRAEIANNARADLFICIHCNSACYRDKKKKKEICNEDTYGVETWVMGLHVAGANLEVAKRENAAVLQEKDYQKKYDGFDPNSPEANIIFSLYQNNFLDQSLKLASFVEREVKKNGREPRGIKQAGFLVLYKTYMPSVLVETGFLTNPSEEQYLTSSKGQDNIAHSIFNAFKSYKSSVETGEEKVSTVYEGKSNATDSVVPIEKPSTPVVVKKDSAPLTIIKPDTSPVIDKKEEKVSSKKTDNQLPVVPKTQDTANHSKILVPTDSIYFSVQILLSTKSLPKTDSRFKGVKNIHEEKENNVYKYTTERLKTFEEASDIRAAMQTKGFKDAFIVAYKNGKRISPVQVRQELKK